MNEPWNNRIIGYSDEPPDQLLANPKNYRTHPGSQADALRGVLADVGIVQNVIANKRTGFLVDGHLRVMEALKAGQPTIPVTWVDLSEAEEALVLASIDPLSAMAGTDAAKLDDLLREVSTDSPAVQQMLDELAVKAGIVPGLGEPGKGGDEFDTTPDEGPTRTALGDLWQIGPHRLIVGDSTDAATVARLMDGERIGGIFTSPPYDQQRTYEGKMASDWLTLMCGVFGAALPHLEDDAQVFVNLGLIHREGRVIRYWDPFIAWMEDTAQAMPLFGWYVWDKINGMPGDWNGRLAPAHEWVFHFTQDAIRPSKTVHSKSLGRTTGATQRTPNGTTKQFTQNGADVQPFKIPDSVIRVYPHMARGQIDDHPAAFPIALPETFIQAYGIDIWYEPFCGSGTSIIAGHRQGRTVYSCEINPRYADICIRRAEAEGLTVEKSQ